MQMVKFSYVLFTDLSIGHANEPFVNQLVCLGISGLPLHDVTLGSLVS